MLITKAITCAEDGHFNESFLIRCHLVEGQMDHPIMNMVVSFISWKPNKGVNLLGIHIFLFIYFYNYTGY